MLKSLEHEIVNAHKYKNIKKLSIFQAQISRECLDWLWKGKTNLTSKHAFHKKACQSEYAILVCVCVCVVVVVVLRPR